MSPTLSAEDENLDALWRAAFGQSLPILGAADAVRAILNDHNLKAAKTSHSPWSRDARVK